MSIDENVAQKAEELARMAAARAASLALTDANEKTKLAVERAVRDALVDRELHDHAEHLRQINGSQQEMATSLSALHASFDQIRISTDAVAQYVTGRSGKRLSTRTQWLMGIGALGGYGGLVAAILTHA